MIHNLNLKKNQSNSRHNKEDQDNVCKKKSSENSKLSSHGKGGVGNIIGRF